MRSFSGIYFFLRFLTFIPTIVSSIANTYSNVYVDKQILLGILFCMISLSMTYIRPYNKVYMNYLDALLILNIALLYFILFARSPMFVIARILLSMPITLLCLKIGLKKIYGTITHRIKVKSLSSKLRFLCKCFNQSLSTTELNEPGISGIASLREEQPLIQTGSSVISYGADNNDQKLLDNYTEKWCP